MKRKPVVATTLRQFDFFEAIPTNPAAKRQTRTGIATGAANLDPLCKALMDKTEAEFFAMFEQPTTPDKE